MKIAIIGAGLAGCNLYNKLSKKGFNIKLFDKSRGTGGRLSTKYIDEMFIDHGTPYINTSNVDFKKFLETKVEEKVLKKINKNFYATKGMNKLCSSLINKDNLIINTRITKAIFENNKWQLNDENQNIYEDFDFLIVTIPATQILENSYDLENSDLEELKNVDYEPMVTLICHKKNSKKIDLSKFENSDLFFKVVDNSKKYNYTDFQSFVLHLNKNLVQKNIELPKDEIFKLVHKNIKEKLHVNLKDEFTVIEHLWKYAFAKTSLKKEFIFNNKKSYGICGDYFEFNLSNSNLETTYLSSSKLSLQIKDEKRINKIPYTSLYL